MYATNVALIDVSSFRSSLESTFCRANNLSRIKAIHALSARLAALIESPFSLFDAQCHRV
jgi:hypothetical protein